MDGWVDGMGWRERKGTSAPCKPAWTMRAACMTKPPNPNLFSLSPPDSLAGSGEKRGDGERYLPTCRSYLGRRLPQQPRGLRGTTQARRCRGGRRTESDGDDADGDDAQVVAPPASPDCISSKPRTSKRPARCEAVRRGPRSLLSSLPSAHSAAEGEGPRRNACMHARMGRVSGTDTEQRVRSLFFLHRSGLDRAVIRRYIEGGLFTGIAGLSWGPPYWPVRVRWGGWRRASADADAGQGKRAVILGVFLFGE